MKKNEENNEKRSIKELKQEYERVEKDRDHIQDRLHFMEDRLRVLGGNIELLETREECKDLKPGDKIVMYDFVGLNMAFILSGTDDYCQPFYGEVIQVEDDNVTAQFDGQTSPETISILKIENMLTDKEYHDALEERKKNIARYS